jgi:putative tricarboxylic transport membrane protein
MGFLMECARIPLGPFVIGFVLAPLAEEKLRSGLMMTAGDFSPIFTRPLPLFFTILAIILLIWPIVGEWVRKRRALRK